MTSSVGSMPMMTCPSTTYEGMLSTPIDSPLQPQVVKLFRVGLSFQGLAQSLPVESDLFPDRYQDPGIADILVFMEPRLINSVPELLHLPMIPDKEHRLMRQAGSALILGKDERHAVPLGQRPVSGQLLLLPPVSIPETRHLPASFPRGPKDLDAGFLLNDLGSAEGDVAKRLRIIRELVNYFLSFGHHVTSSSL